MVEETKRELLRLTDSRHALADSNLGLSQSFRTAIGQLLAFEVAPQAFDRVEVGGVAGQPLDAQPMALLMQVLLHGPALVGGQAIPDQGGLLAAQVTAQVAEEGDQAFGVVAAGAGLEIQAGALSVPAVGQHGTQGEVLPVAGMNQNRSFAAGRPSAPDRGALRDAALVLEEDPGLAAPGVFFTAGQPSLTHCWVAPELRSRACRAGRCRLHSMAFKIFQIWPGWYRTPVNRSTTVAMRGSVHRSVPKPWARAPWRRARSICGSCEWSSFGLRPARPAARSAASPPFRHSRYQRLTLWRLTWSRRATEAIISPARNNLAACWRRSSKAWKSLRGRTSVFMRPLYTKY